MLALARRSDAAAILVQAEAEHLPFAAGSLGGAVANRVYQHLDATAVPLALADLHRCLGVGAPLFLQVFEGDRDHPARSTGDLAGRLFTPYRRQDIDDLLVGAGFTIDQITVEGDGSDQRPSHPALRARARRAVSLPDTVGPAMSVLVCGLNPGLQAAAMGVGFGRPGNRFWPAALAAGLVSRDRDPRHAVTVDGVGMTDLVKRATARAAELDRSDFTAGLGRLERLVTWLAPTVVCVVGLTGWRAARDRHAEAGVQPQPLGGRPVYLMPNPSGLNAHSSLDDFIEHFRTVRRLAAAP